MKIVSLVLFGVFVSIVTGEDDDTVTDEGDGAVSSRNGSELVTCYFEPTFNETELNLTAAERGDWDVDNETLRQYMGGGPPNVTQVIDRTETILDTATTKLAFKLLSEITKEKEWKESKPNLFFSPHNIFNTLLMAYFGSAGDTRTKLQTALQLQGSTYDAVLSAFKTAKNETHSFITDGKSIFYSEKLTIKTEFEDIVGDDIAQLVNFENQTEALNEINEWASDKTQGHIPTLSDKVFPTNTESLLFGVAMFEQQWEVKFQSNLTTLQNFTTCFGNQSEVEMMTRINTTLYADSTELKAEVVNLPFQQLKYRFLVFLPHKGQTIEELISKLDENRLNTVMGSMQPKDIKLLLPQINTMTEVPLEGILKKLGADVMGNKGDFSNMFDKEDEDQDEDESEVEEEDEDAKAHLNGGKYKAVIALDETGTDRLTYQIIMNYNFISLQEVRVDRPFVYMIYYEPLKVPVFMGVVCDPDTE